MVCSPWCPRELDMTRATGASTHKPECCCRNQTRRTLLRKLMAINATTGTCLLVQTGVRLKSTERDPNLNEQNNVLQNTNPENQLFLSQNIINPFSTALNGHLCVCMCVLAITKSAFLVWRLFGDQLNGNKYVSCVEPLCVLLFQNIDFFLFHSKRRPMRRRERRALSPCEY